MIERTNELYEIKFKNEDPTLAAFYPFYSRFSDHFLLISSRVIDFSPFNFT